MLSSYDTEKNRSTPSKIEICSDKELAWTCKNGHTVYCDNCGETKTETIPSTRHTYDAGTITTAATCKNEGVKTYTCTVCGDKKTEAIAKTEHNYEYKRNLSTNATCEEGGANVSVCSICGDPPPAHLQQCEIDDEHP